MSKDLKSIHGTKTMLHARNLHRQSYDFHALAKICPELTPYIFENTFGDETIDFSEAAAVKLLNKALLFYFYDLTFWGIPDNFLCPPVPGRADYLHYMADLLAANNNGKIPMGPFISILDIGVGANCIYPIIGVKEYGWHFVGSDIDAMALQVAENIVERNTVLSNNVTFRLQASTNAIFKGILKPEDRFAFSMCNPPFHDSLQSALEGTLRKWKNLRKEHPKKGHLNFGGHASELICDGGEIGFLQRMIGESSSMPDKVLWYSSLVSKSASLPIVYAALKRAGAVEVKTIEMAQGQKKSRLVAWTYVKAEHRDNWFSASEKTLS
jgi:23S rRNA (adenine1618-N6)-methyltransferase